MRRSINRIVLVGNVGRDPDVRTTTAGPKVAHVSLATSATGGDALLTYCIQGEEPRHIHADHCASLSSSHVPSMGAAIGIVIARSTKRAFQRV